jgi:hypothetical protein
MAQRRPIHRSVQHQHDFHRAGGNAINHDIRETRYDQLACASDVAVAPGFGKLAKAKYRVPNRSPNILSRHGILRGDIRNVTLE